jgi:hypothetical protein
MFHLSVEGIIHKDLAARNVLVTDSFTAKVAGKDISIVLVTKKILG